ncbi:Vitamin B12-dependent ribonucleotide reductase [compost metagenome]
MGLSLSNTPAGYLTEAREAWDKALYNGEAYGYRNAQTTVIAPTGTIGLLMDGACTGVEPEFSLMKWKKVVGGEYFAFVNPNVGRALKTLGYTDDEIKAIEDYIQATGKIEGAPALLDMHLPVFDTANPNGDGKRYIHHMGHILMMAAAQPFLSGAISKTINMPRTATEEEISDAYLKSWQVGLKAVALYRDGCKSSQPLNSKKDEDEEKKEEQYITDLTVAYQNSDNFPSLFADAAAEMPPVRGTRIRLPKRRTGITHEAKIGGQKIFVRTGEYEDGSLGEFFIDIEREGGTIAGFADMLAKISSIALQYGVPVQELIDAMGGHKFEPAGPVQHDNIKMSSSIPDFMSRLLAMEYLGDSSRIQVKPEWTRMDEYAASRMTDDFMNQIEILDEQVNYGETAPIVQAFSVQPYVSATKETEHVADGAAHPPCSNCGGMTKQNGTCRVCIDCGTTTGCS